MRGPTPYAHVGQRRLQTRTPHSMEAFEIAGGGKQGPFGKDVGAAPKQEPSGAVTLLEGTEHWLAELLAPPVKTLGPICGHQGSMALQERFVDADPDSAAVDALRRDNGRRCVVLQDVRYCQRCGHDLARKTIEGKKRAYCGQCGLIVFLDPKVAAAVLVKITGSLVLVRRGIEPAMGRWSFPSGYVDRGESVEDAAVREVKEETGLDVRLTGLVGLYSRAESPVVLAVYSAEVQGGKMRAGHDAEEVGLFDPADLPYLPFDHDVQILKDWLSGRSRER